MACERVKEFLSREGYTFTAKNVEDDDSAYEELIALGVRTIPVAIIGDRMISGFDEPKLREALAGVPKSRA